MRNRNRTWSSGIVCFLVCVHAGILYAQQPDAPMFEAYAIELAVADLGEAVEFYEDVVGFGRQDDGTVNGLAFLGLGETRLVLRERIGSQPRKTTALNLNLYVDDLAKTILKWRKLGVTFVTDKPEPFALGMFIRLRDPAGNAIHLLKITANDLPPAKKPRVFNVGVSLEDLPGSEPLFADVFGIPVSTRAYLPTTLALKKVGAFSIVLHKKERPERALASTEGDRPQVVFATEDLSAARTSLQNGGIKTKNGNVFWGLPSLTFHGAEGHAFRVVELAPFAIPSRAATAQTAGIEDFSWIAGSWTRSDDDGILHETWSEPSGGQLMGMFRWSKNGKTWINEFCTISENDGKIAFRLRHFDSEMTGWEGRKAPFYYPLKSVGDRKAVFENPMRNAPRQFIFSRGSDDILQVEVVGYKDGQESSRWEFRYDRAN